MSEGLKVGLILGGAGLVGFLLWKNSQASSTVAGLGGVAPTSLLGTSPGAPLPPAPSSVVGAVALAPTPATSAGSTSASSLSVSSIGSTVGKLAVAPIVIPTKLAIGAAGAVASAGVSAVKSVGSGISSIGHSIASIF